jgi:hypothetical protein
MKQRNVTISGYILLFIFCITSCSKKSSETPPQVPGIVADSQLASFFEDQLYVWTEINSLILLINKSVATSAAASGEQSVPFQLPCDALVDVNSDANYTFVFLSFDSSDCHGAYTRNGYVAMEVPRSVQWKNQNTETLLYFDQLAITRKSDGKKLTIDGTASFTNLTGGLMHMLTAGDSLSLLFRPMDLGVRFDDTQERICRGRKKLTYRVGTGLEIALEGLSEVNGKLNVLAHGEDRNGDSFVVSVEAPIIFSESCDYRLTGGQLSYEAVGTDGNVTFGVNEDGDPSPCPGQGNAYYFEVDWQRATDPERLQTTIPYAF